MSQKQRSTKQHTIKPQTTEHLSTKPKPTRHQKYTFRFNTFNLTPEQQRQLGKLYTGGMLAISLLLVQSLTSQSTLDRLTFSALFCFALAIPALATATVATLVYTGISRGREITAVIGMLTSSIGILFTLWHFSWIIAAAAFGSVLLCTNIVEWFDPHSDWKKTKKT